MSQRLLNSLIWGFGRGISNTAAKRTSEYIGSKIINPKSKFRKRIDRFTLGGDFVRAKKNIIVLIDNFHEEYILNKLDLPSLQVGTYLQNDIEFIQTKLRMLEILISNEETQRNQYETTLNYWNLIKSEL